jgi:DNA-binding MarR family transcriptional regulator
MTGPAPYFPPPGQGRRGVDGPIGYILRQASSAYTLRMERALGDLEVTPPRYSVLTMLAAFPGLSNADLARLSLWTPQTVSFIVANLLKAGLLERRPHATHGRIQHLDLSDKGRVVLASCQNRAKEVEEDLLAGLSPKDERVVRRWLVQVVQGVDLDQARDAAARLVAAPPKEEADDQA